MKTPKSRDDNHTYICPPNRLINTLASDPMLELGQLAFAILEKINMKISARMQLLSSGNAEPSKRGMSITYSVRLFTMILFPQVRQRERVHNSS